MELRTLLGGLAGDLEKALRRVDDLHSLRLAVVPANAPGMEQLHVLMNVVHDRPRQEHFEALLRVAGMPLLRAFANAGASIPSDLPELWERHHLRQNTMHIGVL